MVGLELTMLRVLKSVAFVTYKEWAAYRSHMAVSLFVGPVLFLVQLFIWQAVFSTRETVGGLTLEQMLAYYGIIAVINYAVFDFADWNLQMLIRTGKFLTFLLRPVSHRWFALSQKAGHRILGFWLELVPVALILHFGFQVDLMPAYPVWAAVSAALSFLMMFLVNYCIGLTAFWLTNAHGIRGMFHLLRDVSAGVFLPLTFLPDVLQKALFVLPFQFIVYVPARVFIGSYELGGIAMSIPQIVGLQAVAVCFMWLVSEMLWRLGIKRFTGVGA
ncbi:ABC transporter permease [Paenibacillus sp. GYB003]|uniref:ABC transporter permease n=1 Tax=Paenibacillus sp. GYB003 TaxID=2994392 RepID=UPI002F963E09